MSSYNARVKDDRKTFEENKNKEKIFYKHFPKEFYVCHFGKTKVSKV